MFSPALTMQCVADPSTPQINKNDFVSLTGNGKNFVASSLYNANILGIALETARPGENVVIGYVGIFPLLLASGNGGIDAGDYVEPDSNGLQQVWGVGAQTPNDSNTFMAIAMESSEVDGVYLQFLVIPPIPLQVINSSLNFSQFVPVFTQQFVEVPDGARTVFTPNGGVNLNSIAVYEGTNDSTVKRLGTSLYSYDGTHVTFATAPPNGATIFWDGAEPLV